MTRDLVHGGAGRARYDVIEEHHLELPDTIDTFPCNFIPTSHTYHSTAYNDLRAAFTAPDHWPTVQRIPHLLSRDTHLPGHTSVGSAHRRP